MAKVPRVVMVVHCGFSHCSVEEQSQFLVVPRVSKVSMGLRCDCRGAAGIGEATAYA